jgi:hypothetical protein
MMLFILILFFILIKVSPFINNSHLKFKFQRYLSNKDRDFYEKIIQSKDETIKVLLSSKDEAIKSKDEAIKILLSSKDEAIKSKDELSSRDGEHIKLLKSNLAAKNAVIYDLQGRLSLRSVIEDFENNSIKEYNEAGKGESRRERAWDVILRNNYCGITSELGSDNSKSWIPVAKELYKRISDDIHKYRSEKVIINRTSMTEDMVTLAAAICKSFPIEYEIITPPQTKHM